MKSLLIILVFSSLCFSAFDENEIMSLTSQERIELLQHLPDSKKRELADSISVWGTRRVMSQYQKAMVEYPKMMEKLKSTMEESMSRMAAQVGFSMMFNVIAFILNLILGILMYRKIRTVTEEDGKLKVQGRKFYLIWIITLTTLFIAYAFINILAF